MSVASDLIDKVQRTGAKFELTPTGFNVRCAPGSVPQEFQSDLRQHKPEILLHLIQRRYEPVYPHQDQREDELKELVRRVEEEGYVLLWCEVLRDLVAFHRDDVDPATIRHPSCRTRMTSFGTCSVRMGRSRHQMDSGSSTLANRLVLSSQTAPRMRNRAHTDERHEI